MSVNEDHIRHCLLYEFNQGISGSQALINICKTYGENVLSKTKCYWWFKKFENVNFDL